MDIHMFSPYIHWACRSVIDANAFIKHRVIYDYELICLESSAWILTLNLDEIYCKAGDVVLLRPGMTHSIKGMGKAPISQPHIHFDIEYDQDSKHIPVSFKNISDMSKYEKSLIRKDILPTSGPIIKIKNTKAFKELFFNLIDEYSRNGNSLSTKASMIKILDIIIKDNFENIVCKTENNSIAEIKNYLDNNYENRITLKTLSLHFNYDSFYIEKKFKQTYGIPVIKYYNRLRLCAAKKLLIKTKNVGNVSNKLNFTDIYTFSRFFKNAVGISPSMYIKNNS